MIIKVFCDGSKALPLSAAGAKAQSHLATFDTSSFSWPEEGGVFWLVAIFPFPVPGSTLLCPYVDSP